MSPPALFPLTSVNELFVSLELVGLRGFLGFQVNHPPHIQRRSRCRPLVHLLVEDLWGCIVTTRSTGRLGWDAL